MGIPPESDLKKLGFKYPRFMMEKEAFIAFKKYCVGEERPVDIMIRNVLVMYLKHKKQLAEDYPSDVTEDYIRKRTDKLRINHKLKPLGNYK